MKTNFKTISEPTNNVIFSKAIGKNTVWLTTKENNFYAVWRGHTEDTNVWEESDWLWELQIIFDGKNQAIEACVLASLKENQP